jgi:hypothetical protein
VLAATNLPHVSPNPELIPLAPDSQLCQLSHLKQPLQLDDESLHPVFRA